MKILLFTLFILPLPAVGQNLTEYTAKNKITYKVGDTVHLGVGSLPAGDFQYLKAGGFNAVLGHGHNMPIHSNMAKKAVVIKNIKGNKSGIEQTYFVIGAGALTSLNLYIDAAIRVCEVTPCETNISIADELTKLKKLLDDGALTQAEYDIQKKKLLNPNR